MDRTEYLKTVPAFFRKHFEIAFDSDAKRSAKRLRSAIKAKCLDCACWQFQEVLQCVAINCPLYELRSSQIQNSGASGISARDNCESPNPDFDKPAAKGEGLRKWRLNQAKLKKEGLK